MREAYSLSLEQLNWRRWCIREQCGRDVDKFKQEYPANDVECFLLSGRGMFDGKMLARMLLAVEDPPFRGNLIPDRSNILGIRLDENSNGFLKIFKPPRIGARYIIGGDVAEGLIHGDFLMWRGP